MVPAVIIISHRLVIQYKNKAQRADLDTWRHVISCPFLPTHLPTGVQAHIRQPLRQGGPHPGQGPHGEGAEEGGGVLWWGGWRCGGRMDGCWGMQIYICILHSTKRGERNMPTT